MEPQHSAESENRAIPEDDIVAFLTQPSSYREKRSTIHVIETHAARIFLAGAKAYKLKKRVTLPFLDFSTLELRRKALARELELNQPHAPEIYLGLLPITSSSGGVLKIGGAGEPVEWVLEMRRFDQGDLLSERARNGPLPKDICVNLAAILARYHQMAPAKYDRDHRQRLAETLQPLLAGLDGSRAIAGTEPLAALRRGTKTALEENADLLSRRMTAGAVRRCHGDLHLGNIVMIGDRPVPFDALEFNEQLGTIDVLYDLAFLLMDLESRGDHLAANLVLNAYIGAAPLGTELEGLPTLPLFLAMRAAVRALVATTRAHQQTGAEVAGTLDEARRLISLANSFIYPAPPVLVAIGGFSGTGKSKLSAALAPMFAPAPGAVHLRTDVERKRLFGVSETERLSPEHYLPAVSEEVHRIVFNKAARTLAAGHSVVVDAVFAKPEEREAVAAIARNAGSVFAGLWLEAPADTLLERVASRQGDASDAGAAVVRAQLALKLGTLTWSRIDARGSAGKTSELAHAALSKSKIILRGYRRPYVRPEMS